LGITFSAVLSGFGSIHSPYTSINYFRPVVAESEVRYLERRLIQQHEHILARQHKFAQARRAHARARLAAPAQRKGALASLGAWLFGGRTDPARITEAEERREISSLRSLVREMFLEINELRVEQARVRYSQTVIGRAVHMGAYGLSVYAVYKIAMSARNILFTINPKTDPVTRGLDIALKFAHIDIDVVFWSQQLSFFFVGILVAISVRGFLVTVLKMFHSLSSPVSNSSVVLLLAQAMGLFFISNIVLMRANLPTRYRSLVTGALGDIHFNFYHRWFDLIFISSAAATLLVTTVQHQERRGRTSQTKQRVQ